MQINRLRLTGFKSFVEPTELVIAPGLTGVVGPNGCGKSNLLEALRWVMGETSHKSMRAAAMDDVIFAGTSARPARNTAEVTIVLDNSARTAPAEFNGADVIEIARRIEREAGSAYRINGQEVRARDVKILFEDAATGARSPALVRQGQIAEIVNAKPEQRRRILEDAAGVAGLHSRRHDAELRLKAAESNLARLADVMGSLTSQIESLKRQARQARRYKEISAEIRKTEAVAAHVAWTDAEASVQAEEAQLREVLGRLGAAVETESRTQREETGLAERLQPLREQEAIRAAVLARLSIERDNFEKEAERARARARELVSRVEQLDADIVRESQMVEEAAETLARLDDELSVLVEGEDGAADATEAVQTKLDEAKRAEAAAAARHADLTRRDFEVEASRRSLAASLAERREQAARLGRQLAELDEQARRLAASAPDAERLAALAATVEELGLAAEDAEGRVIEAEDRLSAVADEVRQRREAVQQTSLELRGIDTEHATLARILRPRSGDGFTPLLDAITVAPGYEAALGAALGDDLDAPVSDAAEADAVSGDASPPLLHWLHIAPHDDDGALPAGASPLADKVTGPRVLQRRLAQVGVVDAADGPRMQPALKPGQRLVSRAGDLWRWDGFVATAEAPTAAAERLAQRNRLAEIEVRRETLQGQADAATELARTAEASQARIEAGLRDARQSVRDINARLARTREEMAALERSSREADARRAAVDDARSRAVIAHDEANASAEEAAATLDAVEEPGALADEIAAAQAIVTEARARTTSLAGELAGIERERRMRAERLASTKAEHQRWSARSTSATRQADALKARAQETRAELEGLADLPAEIEAQRQRLNDELAKATAERNAAADTLVETETRLRDVQAALRAAQTAVATEREARARIEARLEAARNRRADEARRIAEQLGCAPEECLGLAQFPEGAALPALDELERQLARLKGDRERLGGVNLAADQELETIGAQFDTMEKEKLDVEAAIAKLRGAIQQLNREGKSRIDDAFKAVDGHFRSLFTTLFNGGEARLEMIEGEDPLEGGLEIIAKPPGKKPATLSLLSGGEQTLTALSLIFAVFLTNPSPICVLDEVDAPLDNSNVDRFSTLMEKMAADTDTRFLVITHHPMTMARMHRLFGVTMVEKGVSQLVSVDLATAERIVDDEPQRQAS